MTSPPPPPSSNRTRARKGPPPPKHLALPERRLWEAILRENLLDNEAALSILRSTLEAHQRARTCRETVDREGAIYRDRFTMTNYRVCPLGETGIAPTDKAPITRVRLGATL